MFSRCTLLSLAYMFNARLVTNVKIGPWGAKSSPFPFEASSNGGISRRLSSSSSSSLTTSPLRRVITFALGHCTALCPYPKHLKHCILHDIPLDLSSLGCVFGVKISLPLLCSNLHLFVSPPLFFFQFDFHDAVRVETALVFTFSCL